MDTRKAGKAAGYIFSYVVFTLVLYSILLFSGRLPYGWSFLHLMLISGIISSSGYALRRWLP